MKKILVLLLVLTLFTTLFACSSAGTAESENIGQDETTTINVSEEAEEYQTITFDEPIILCDDHTVKIEMIAFYEEFYNWADHDEAVEKGITFQFTNKTNDEIMVSIYDVYLGNHNAECVMVDRSRWICRRISCTRRCKFFNHRYC